MKDTYNRIHRLLHLYYSGLSNVAEENELKEFYLSHPVLPDDLEKSRALFSFNSSESIPGIPESARTAVNRLIDSLEQQEQVHSRGYRWVTSLGIAASLLIVISIGVFLLKNSAPNPYELTDPAEAYTETKRALLVVAESFSLAEKEAQEANMILESLLTNGLNDSLLMDDEESAPFSVDTIFSVDTSSNI